MGHCWGASKAFCYARNLTLLANQPLGPLPDQPIGRRERRAVNLRGVAARTDGSTAAVRITDFSNGGCGLETSVRLIPGERVELSIELRGAIAALVRWCVGGRAGLTFEAVPAAPKQVLRSSKRTKVLTEVAMRRSGSVSYRVQVLEVSLSGCRLELVDRPEVGELVWIRFDGLEAIEAKVCWIAGFKAGLKFSNPIHPAVFDLLLARFQRGVD